MATTSAKTILPFCADCSHSGDVHEHYSHTSYCVEEGCDCPKFIPMTTLRKFLKLLGIGLFVLFLALIMTVQF